MGCVAAPGLHRGQPFRQPSPPSFACSTFDGTVTVALTDTIEETNNVFVSTGTGIVDDAFVKVTLAVPKGIPWEGSGGTAGVSGKW